MTQVQVKPDRVKKLRNFYPWLYRDEIETLDGSAEPGELVNLVDARGEYIARAFYNASSQVVARVVTYDPIEAINRGFFERRLEAAQARRAGSILNTNAVRLVHAEADQLPGLIVDRFGDMLVVQFRNPGVEAYRKEIVQALKRVTGAASGYERSDMQARREEGLEPRTGELFGQVPDQVTIYEDDLKFDVNPALGQKTGFYLDQRDNRRLLHSLVRQDSRVLDVFSYTGGFALHAASMGARALAVDKDQAALQQLELNARRNGLDDRVGVRWGDAEKILTQLRTEERFFTHIILDPPTLAKHKNEVPPAKQLFTTLSTSAIKLLEPDGVLFVSTCAYHITVNDLIEATRIAAGEVGRRVSVMNVTYQPADHPWILQVPETLYLKTLILRIH